MIVGIYFQHHVDGSDPTPVGGVTIGLFREAFVPGTVQYQPPAPIARVDDRRAESAQSFTKRSSRCAWSIGSASVRSSRCI